MSPEEKRQLISSLMTDALTRIREVDPDGGAVIIASFVSKSSEGRKVCEVIQSGDCNDKTQRMALLAGIYIDAGVSAGLPLPEGFPKPNVVYDTDKFDGVA